MAIIGISGSPVVGGNTDRLIKAILEMSGRETRFLNLSTLDFCPCRNCAQLCGTTNECGIMDDLQPYLAEIRDAQALVLGTPIEHGNMTGWMFSFITRLWSLYQVKKLLQDKPVILVSVGIHTLETQNGIKTFQDTATYSTKFHVLGHLYYNSRTPPCYKCGAGHYCKVGGLWNLLGRDEEKLEAFKFTPDKIKKWEDESEVVSEVEKYTQILKNLDV